MRWFAPRRWFNFSGRASRRELLAYWLVICLAFLLPLLLVASFDMRATARVEVTPGAPLQPLDWFLMTFSLLYMVMTFVALVASLAVKIRRLHDSDKSGWNIFWGVIPLIGGLIVLVLLFLPGDDFENSYGPDPRAPQGPELGDLERVF